jgi:hypothetical protein
MKKIFSLFLILYSTAFLFGQWQENRQPITSQKYVNTRDGIRLRDDSSLYGKILTIIPYDGMVVLFGEYSNEVIIDNIQGKWAKVFYSNLIGWVFDGYLSDKNSFGEITHYTHGEIFENIKREFMLENILDKNTIQHIKITINSDSKSIETFRGFKIGDSIEELLRKYPCAIKEEPRKFPPFEIDTNYYYWTISLLLSDWIPCYFLMKFYFRGNIIHRIDIEYNWADLSAHIAHNI